MDCAIGGMYESTYPDPVYKDFSPIFSTKSFTILHFNFINLCSKHYEQLLF